MYICIHISVLPQSRGPRLGGLVGDRLDQVVGLRGASANNNNDNNDNSSNSSSSSSSSNSSSSSSNILIIVVIIIISLSPSPCLQAVLLRRLDADGRGGERSRGW